MIVELAIDNNHVLEIKLEVDTNPPLAATREGPQLV